MCCGPRPKDWYCLHCGVEIDKGDPQVRAVFFYGRRVRFCALRCQRLFIESWFGLPTGLEK